MQDLTRRAGAGAALVTALYYAQAEWWKHPMPPEVLHAYMHACQAYGINPPPEVKPWEPEVPSPSPRT